MALDCKLSFATLCTEEGELALACPVYPHLPEHHHPQSKPRAADTPRRSAGAPQSSHTSLASTPTVVRTMWHTQCRAREQRAGPPEDGPQADRSTIPPSHVLRQRFNSATAAAHPHALAELGRQEADHDCPQDAHARRRVGEEDALQAQRQHLLHHAPPKRILLGPRDANHADVKGASKVLDKDASRNGDRKQRCQGASTAGGRRAVLLPGKDNQNDTGIGKMARCPGKEKKNQTTAGEGEIKSCRGRITSRCPRRCAAVTPLLPLPWQRPSPGMIQAQLHLN